MRIIALNGFIARCEAKGVERDVSLFMMRHETDLQIGDFLMVHVGYAIQKMTPEDAQTTWELFDSVETAYTEAENRA